MERTQRSEWAFKFGLLAGIGVHSTPPAASVSRNSRPAAFGRAYAGSQRQIQTYVNRRRADLDAAILRGLPELAVEGAQLEWVSPLEEERFKEYQDGTFLGALGRLDLYGMLAEIWHAALAA